MSKTDKDQAKLLPAFSALKRFEQMAVTLKADGRTNEQIMNMVNNEYEMAYKLQTVKEWFYTNGRLYPAYLEFNDMLAEQAVHNAKQRLKRLSETAVDTLEITMSDTFEGSVRERSARTILNKYIPDRQVIMDTAPVDDLPEDIRKRADVIAASGANNAQKPVDDQGQGSTDGDGAGERSDPAVS